MSLSRNSCVLRDAILYVRDICVEEEDVRDEMRALECGAAHKRLSDLDESIRILLDAPFSMAASTLSKMMIYLVVVKLVLDLIFFKSTPTTRASLRQATTSKMSPRKASFCAF